MSPKKAERLTGYEARRLRDGDCTGKIAYAAFRGDELVAYAQDTVTAPSHWVLQRSFICGFWPWIVFRIAARYLVPVSSAFSASWCEMKPDTW
jgi:hypothetical protein